MIPPKLYPSELYKVSAMKKSKIIEVEKCFNLIPISNILF